MRVLRILDGVGVARRTCVWRDDPLTDFKTKGCNMTDKTRVVAVRLPNEVADWVESEGSARAFIEGLYGSRSLNLRGFYKACDEREIDYQLAINRMVELINED